MHPKAPVWYHDSLFGEQDTYFFNTGTHTHAFEKLGSHLREVDGTAGTNFAVWAPSAEKVSVIGDFNGWDQRTHRLQPVRTSGIWEGFIPGVTSGSHYKYFIQSKFAGYSAAKADPYAVHQETPPHTASVVWDASYSWSDTTWMNQQQQHNSLKEPLSVYEVHAGSWRRDPLEPKRFLTYRELAEQLPAYVKSMGFTHVEFMPIMEHPFYGSWGYQITGFFSPTARYGTPQDFKYLIDACHQEGIGVILDWVPSHFPTDEPGLGYFDGTHLYEHADPRLGFHPDWNTYIFNLGKSEVQSFLLSNAYFWLEHYHADALRVDAVSSMLYLDYSRKAGEWLPNRYGGRENLESIAFLKKLNTSVNAAFPAIQMVAEEATSWPQVTGPIDSGGLDFGLKWDMGWMNDTLRYLERDPLFRRHNQHELTFRMVYAANENYLLPLSHDEVVYGKGSLLNKMPGDDWQKFANLRLLFGYMYGQLGKKLIFMGGEFGQWGEWNHDEGLPWPLTQEPVHAGIQRWVKDLNHLYTNTPALYQWDSNIAGFEWIDCNDSAQSILLFLRRGEDKQQVVVVCCNFTPIPREYYPVGVPLAGPWREVLNSDDTRYGGTGSSNAGDLVATATPAHGRPFSLHLTLPPLSTIFLTVTMSEETGDEEPETPVEQ